MGAVGRPEGKACTRSCGVRRCGWAWVCGPPDTNKWLHARTRMTPSDDSGHACVTPHDPDRGTVASDTTTHNPRPSPCSHGTGGNRVVTPPAARCSTGAPWNSGRLIDADHQIRTNGFRYAQTAVLCYTEKSTETWHRQGRRKHNTLQNKHSVQNVFLCNPSACILFLSWGA